MAREIVCESCGKTWRVDCPTVLSVRVQSCQDCGRFKFHIEPPSVGKKESQVNNSNK